MSARAQLGNAANNAVNTLWGRVPEMVFWIFTLGTTAYLAWIGSSEIWARLSQSQAATTATNIFAISNGSEVVWNGAGLSWEGIPGALIALAQAAAVTLGMLFLLARRLRPRILGAMITVGWAALWAANATAFAAKSGTALTWLLAIAYSLPLIAAVVVSMRRMGSVTRRRRTPRRTPRGIPAVPPRFRTSNARGAIDHSDVPHIHPKTRDVRVAS